MECRGKRNIENKERDTNDVVDPRTGLSLITISGVLRMTRKVEEEEKALEATKK